MAYDEHLAERVRELMASPKGVTEQRMFGGIAFMLDGKMAVGVNKESLMVRVPVEDHDEALTEPGARIMDFTGRPMKGFLFIDPAGTKSAASLKEWVERSASYVATLPAKKRPKKKRA